MRGWWLLLALGLTACGEPPVSAPDRSATTLTEPFIGRWANSFTDCALAPGSGENAPIEITATTMTGAENACAFDRVEVEPDADEALITRRCEGEGEVTTDTLDLRVKGNTLLVAFEEGGAVTWTRCPTQDGGQPE